MVFTFILVSGLFLTLPSEFLDYLYNNSFVPEPCFVPSLIEKLEIFARKCYHIMPGIFA